jgi:hypothetical protein
MKRNIKPTASKLSKTQRTGETLHLIPAHLVSKLARETGAACVARTFSPWSHVVCMLFVHLTHAIGLNDVCDAAPTLQCAAFGLTRGECTEL